MNPNDNRVIYNYFKDMSKKVHNCLKQALTVLSYHIKSKPLSHKNFNLLKSLSQGSIKNIWLSYRVKKEGALGMWLYDKLIDYAT